jgi:hypothetical protein
MPDLDLVTANGPLRVLTLLHNARPAAQPRIGVLKPAAGIFMAMFGGLSQSCKLA